MTTLSDIVKAVIRQEGFSFAESEQRNVLLLPFRVQDKTWLTAIRVDEERGFVTIRSNFEFAPAPKRAAAGEFINRANFGIRLGAMQIDLNDGEVMMNTSACFGGTEGDTEVIRHLLRCNLVMTESYLPGYKAVISGEATPAEAVARCDGVSLPAVVDEPARTVKFGGRLTDLN